MRNMIISTTFLCADVEITITQQEGSVDINITSHLGHGDGYPEGWFDGEMAQASASMEPEFAQKLGAALQCAGYDAEPDEPEEDD